MRFLVIFSLLVTLPLIATSANENVFGFSVQNRPLVDVTIGHGEEHLFLVGGIHGGYEWNTVLLTRKLIHFFEENPNLIPGHITIHLIDNLNPDGLHQLLGTSDEFSVQTAKKLQAPYLQKSGLARYKGRFNANGVDLNRNWGYNWIKEAFLGPYRVNAGTEPFSEPESVALRELIMSTTAKAVIFYHSAWNEIFAAGAGAKDPASISLAYRYGHAADYPVSQYFDQHPLNGDAGDWLAAKGIPSITVELRNHQDLEYQKNLKGVLALLVNRIYKN